MYMYKPNYKNNKLILDVKPEGKVKQTLSIIGYTMIPSLIIAVPILLDK